MAENESPDADAPAIRYSAPAEESQQRTDVRAEWKQRRAAAFAAVMEHFGAEAATFIMEGVLELEALHTRYTDALSTTWLRSLQGAYERGQKDGISGLTVMEDVATGKIDPDEPPPPPTETRH
jgi:hypothetical protein